MSLYIIPIIVVSYFQQQQSFSVPHNMLIQPYHINFNLHLMCKGTETQNTNHGFKPLASKSD